MVLETFMINDENNLSTMSDRIVIEDDLIYSVDESTNTYSSPSSSVSEESEGNSGVKHFKMFMNANVDNNSTTVLHSSHEKPSISNENNCITILSLSNNENNMHNNMKILKSKLNRVLRKREQYRRRVESLTNGIIALRGSKLVLERKISGAKLSWDMKHNKNINM